MCSRGYKVGEVYSDRRGKTGLTCQRFRGHGRRKGTHFHPVPEASGKKKERVLIYLIKGKLFI